MHYVKRREFITLLGGAAAAWPFAARAQGALPVVGVLGGTTRDEWTPFLAALKFGLKDAGFIDRQNVAIEDRWADGRYERLPALAAELVRRRVAVIVAIGGVASARAAKSATSTVPIVFLVGRDPVELGFVGSYNRPGGNMTGVHLLNLELAAKRLELLRELVPNAATIAVLINPDNPNNRANAENLEATARVGGQRVIVLNANAARDFEPAFATLLQQRAQALIVAADPFLDGQRGQIVALTMRYAVPAIFQWREFVEAGGLVSYGTSLTGAHRQQGVYAGKILNGANPAELPVVQPTKFDLVINRKTASALGITIPPTLLVAADEVIE
jgi:putative tryptophan/tyrosine transport system substrate-binding protein